MTAIGLIAPHRAYLPTAVTESCIDARQLFCEKASNINGLRDFLIFFRIFGAWAGWRS